MNFVFISPHFPHTYWQFCDRLHRNGVNVLGIGDAPYDGLEAPLKAALTEYYRVDSLEDYDQVYRAVAFFAFRYGKIVLATTTYNADIFPFLKEFIEHLTERNFQNRKIGFIENGSWAPTAAKVMKGMLEGCKNTAFAETEVKILSAMTEENKAQIEQLAKEML